MGSGACAETGTRDSSRWPARENCADSLALVYASSRYLAAGNKPADSAHVRGCRIPHRTASPHSNRKSLARRFAVRALAGTDKKRATIFGGASSGEPASSVAEASLSTLHYE